MGYQQAKSKAMSALQLALDNVEPPLTQEQKEKIVRNFEREL